MKKLIISVCVFLALSGYTVAQTSPVKTEAKKTVTHKTTVKKNGSTNTNTTTNNKVTVTRSKSKPATAPATRKQTRTKVTKTVKKTNS